MGRTVRVRSGSVRLLYPGILAVATLLPLHHGGLWQDSRALAGRWTLTLWIDSSRTARPSRPGSAITGTITLKPVAGSERITLVGRYSLPFDSFGLSPNAESVLAFAIGRDSLRVILRPDVDHGHAELVGQRRLGEIEGRWTWIGDPTRAAGRFVMRR